MAVVIFWTNFARKELRKIFDYYKENAGVDIARKLTEGIVAKANSLDFQMKIGQKEPLLSARPEDFRYLVFKSYKIIYWYNDAKKRIEIADVFDARQYPEKLKRNK